MGHNIFKENFEGRAAKDFLTFYNSRFQTSYDIYEEATDPSKVPDFKCRDVKTGEELWFDVTNAAILKDAQMIYKKILLHTETHDTKRRPQTQDIESTFPHYKNKIEEKFHMRYGQNCALVVRYCGFSAIFGLENYLNRLRQEIDYSKSPYDKGVWFSHFADAYRLDINP